MFKGKKGQALVEDLGKKSNTFVPGEPVKAPQRTAAEKEERDLILVEIIILITVSFLRKIFFSESN